MKSFKEFFTEIWDKKGYRDNPIPGGKYNEDNVHGPVYHIEKEVSKGNISTHHINVPKMVKDGTLKSTQDHLHKHGGGDPVFDDLEKPVLFKDEHGVHHIIDGHHRLAHALENNKTRTSVHIFSK